MKTSVLLCLCAASVLMACEHHVRTGTVVHEDGSLDRIIVYKRPKDGDDEKVRRFDTSKVWKRDSVLVPIEKNAWGTKKPPSDTALINDAPTEATTTGYAERMTGHFNSVEAVNKVMNIEDNAFRIESRFEKKFRWFYTYMVYSDTYKSLNKYTRVPLSDYFTREDYAFIQRLPAEMAKISKSDSLYLDQLNNKFYDQYLQRSYFEEYYANLQSILQRHMPGASFQDSLKHTKEKLFRVIQDSRDIDDLEVIDALKHMGILLSDDARSEYDKWIKEQEIVWRGMIWAAMGKYEHHIDMPWPVFDTNADSVAGHTMFWRPPVTKFLATDYTMYAESRKLNYWAVVVSVLFMLGAGVLVFRRRAVS